MRKVKKLHLFCAVFIIVIILGVFFVFMTGAKKVTVDKVDDSKILVVYTSHEKDVYEPVINEFQERTGIWVEVVTGGTKELLAQIAEEKASPYADVMFGGGIDSISAGRDNFDDWKAFSKFPVVLIYNTKLVYEAGIPQKWEDLLDNYWRGKIACADPRVSGSSFTALTTMIQILDKDNMDRTMTQLVLNCNGSFLNSSSMVIDSVNRGEKLVGITSEDKALKAIAADKNIGIIYPLEGTTAVPDATAVVKNCAHPENAKLFLEFTQNPDVQQYIEEFCYRRSATQKSMKIPLEKEVEYDMEWSIINRDLILEQFIRAIKGVENEKEIH